MLKFLVVSVLLGIVASETDIFGDHEWYLLRLYANGKQSGLPCYIFKLKKLKSTCTCNGAAVSTLSLQIEDEDTPPIPYLLLEEEDNIADVLRLKCTCPKKNSPPVHLAFKPLTNDKFIAYVSARGPGEGLLLGSEKMSEADLDKFVKGVNELKNLNTYINICLTGKESTGGQKKLSLFPSTA